MPQLIDLRSDTITLPTPEMIRAMANAELGDDVYGEDPTTIRLEAVTAEMFGKEAGLFVASGTMGNLVAVLAHTQKRRAPEVICEFNCHLILNECGSYSHLGGISMRGIPSEDGSLDPTVVESCIRNPDNPHHPVTQLICLENTHNFSGGQVIGFEKMNALKEVADRHGIPMHLDGARVFNAATALGVPVAEIAKLFSSVQVCLSKGLSAPVGSVVVGDRDFIRECRRMRKMLGGGLRQCGVIAAAGLVGVTTMVERLGEDHENARTLAKGLAEIPGIGVDLGTVQSNMVRISTEGLGITGAVFSERMKALGVLCSPPTSTTIRFVTNRHIGEAEVLKTVEAAAKVAEGCGVA